MEKGEEAHLALVKSLRAVEDNLTLAENEVFAGEVGEYGAGNFGEYLNKPTLKIPAYTQDPNPLPSHTQDPNPIPAHTQDSVPLPAHTQDPFSATSLSCPSPPL